MNNNDIYDQGCWIINARVEVIVLEEITQTLKYQPLGFWLQHIKHTIINGCHGRSVSIMGLHGYILAKGIFMINNDIYDQGCYIINGRVEVIVPAAIAQTRYYQTLGF